MAIIKLDDHTIDQIAAGEVIESPASVVKELFENSIDAKARSITVEIKNGGKAYIRVTDDGIGIASNELPLAFEKHATSKISSFEDLYDIYTLGFRGEALPSIASVSDVLAISKTKDSQVGSKIMIRGTKLKQSPIATNTGTTIEIFDLFKNLPARQKFLKSDMSETNAITRLMYSLAIGYSDVSIKYIKDGKVEFRSFASEPDEIRFANLLDDYLKDNLLEIESDDGIYKIHGYISNGNYYRGTRAFQYLYVNNRLIDSSLIIEAIEREYRSLIPNGRFPAIFLFIETNPKNLDVNIHPNKKTIKFNYEDQLIESLENAVKNKLFENLSPETIKIDEKPSKSLADFSNYERLLDKYANFNIVREERPAYEDKIEDTSFFDATKEIQIDLPQADDKEEFIEESYIDKHSYTYLTSLFGRYSLFSKSSNEIILLDHRRADQAIKCESYLKQIKDAEVVSQVLLAPLRVRLKAADKIKFLNKKDFIESLGIDVDFISDDELIIRSLPQIFEEAEDERFFYDILDMDITFKEEVFDKNLYKLIKSNSFRKGHVISDMSAKKLMDDLMSLDNPYKTYDGKAIMIEISKELLEKYFD